ncbi:DUF3800 domain-containing protein [Hathewaya massiliensis]|uniref:DUF3800 domain-containing protein n=1 Tax=Hathewaya massiliensis TaxID=1964382 RepID=UPI00163B9574|nr:DUF3800 domain-containing protein [Hathewaya massiliensis]
MDIEIYCDESRQDLFCNRNSIKINNRYICIGGVLINKSIREELKNSIKELQKKHNVFNEFKWKTVTPSKYDFYEELIDLFFSYDEKLKFRCIVIDAEQIDMKTYNNDDSELGFYKFYYQLLVYWIDKHNQYNVYTDYKINRKNTRLKELKEILNAKSGDRVNLIQAINSKESLILQLEDVLMGAVGYKYNYKNHGTAIAKNKLISKLEHRLNTELDSSNNRYNKKFNVFKMDLRGRR